jgi:MurNAc alpha-1-phosphate uridylyltransferase
MKAIILAAGRGERMRPLTDHTPKPLLRVRGKPLIEWHLEGLARGGVRDVVVNTAWLEEQIVATLGNGERFGMAIRYSLEGRDHGGALETAGGLKKALPLLGVPNPPQHPGGDFGLAGGLATVADGGASFTWSGIGLFRPNFVNELMAELALGEKARLRPYLDAAIAQRRLGARRWEGGWADVGTPERLRALDEGDGCTTAPAAA